MLQFQIFFEISSAILNDIIGYLKLIENHHDQKDMFRLCNQHCGGGDWYNFNPMTLGDLNEILNR